MLQFVRLVLGLAGQSLAIERPTESDGDRVVCGAVDLPENGRVDWFDV